MVVIGLGNDILSDDAVGLLVARLCASRLTEASAPVRESMRGGLELLELLDGHEVAHLIDAIVTGRAAPGHIWRFGVDELPPSITLAGSHEVDLPTALALGRELGYRLPAEIVIWAIEVSDPFTVGESLTPAVRDAIEPCAEGIARAVGGER